jgi:hypothetical protein
MIRPGIFCDAPKNSHIYVIVSTIVSHSNAFLPDTLLVNEFILHK